MSFEDFQLIDETEIDDSFLDIDFSENHHQQSDNLIDSDKNIDFVFGDNNNYYQIGEAFLQFELLLKINGGQFEDFKIDITTSIKNAFARFFKEATIMTTRGSAKEQNKYVRLVCTIMRVLTSKDGNLSSNLIKVMKIITITHHWKEY